MRRTRAFSLIEILVVMGILAILAAIVFPIVSGAKRSTKKVSSISNMRQIGTAIMVYAGDYDDTYPHGLPMVWRFAREAVAPDLLAHAKTAPFVEDVLRAWGVTDEILKAPGDPSAIEGESQFEIYGTSYQLQRRPFLQPRTMTSYDRPTEQPLGWEVGQFHDMNKTKREARLVVLYMDGHVDYKPHGFIMEQVDENP